MSLEKDRTIFFYGIKTLTKGRTSFIDDRTIFHKIRSIISKKEENDTTRLEPFRVWNPEGVVKSSAVSKQNKQANKLRNCTLLMSLPVNRLFSHLWLLYEENLH